MNYLKQLQRIVRQDKATRQAILAMGLDPAPQAVRVTSVGGKDVWAHFREDGTYWTEEIDWVAFQDEQLEKMRKI